MGRYTKPPNGLARPPNGLAGRIKLSIFDLLGHIRDVSQWLDIPVSSRSLLGNPHLFAGTAIFASSHLPNPWTLYNSSSLCKNLPLRNLWSRHKNSSSQSFTSLQPLIPLISFISSQEPPSSPLLKPFSPAIFIGFASFFPLAICLLMAKHTCLSPNGAIY